MILLINDVAKRSYMSAFQGLTGLICNEVKADAPVALAIFTLLSPTAIAFSCRRRLFVANATKLLPPVTWIHDHICSSSICSSSSIICLQHLQLELGYKIISRWHLILLTLWWLVLMLWWLALQLLWLLALKLRWLVVERQWLFLNGGCLHSLWQPTWLVLGPWLWLALWWLALCSIWWWRAPLGRWLWLALWWLALAERL